MIGRAKTADPDNYEAIYDEILAQMNAQIDEIKATLPEYVQHPLLTCQPCNHTALNGRKVAYMKRVAWCCNKRCAD